MGWNDEQLYEEGDEPAATTAVSMANRGPAAVATAEDAERARREQAWAIRHPGEWDEWVRIRPLLTFFYVFGAEEQFGFEDFLKEVGRRPSPDHVVVRPDETKGYEPGNMAWSAGVPEPSPSPYLNVEQAAAFLGVAPQTLYNNRRHIPALPGFRKLMFEPKVLEEVRASDRFRSKRLADQRRKRDRSSSI